MKWFFNLNRHFQLQLKTCTTIIQMNDVNGMEIEQKNLK